MNLRALSAPAAANFSASARTSARSSITHTHTGVFTVEQHVRGKWVCRQCETLIQAPVSAQVIDKGLPTAGLLAHVMVTKFADHLLLYRQEKIFGRVGLVIACSTQAQWVRQTGVQLQPLVDALREAVLAEGVSTPMKPRCRCSHRVRRKPAARMFRPTAARSFRHSRPWFTTSVQAEQLSMRITFSAPGTANWCATTLLVTKPGSRKV